MSSLCKHGELYHDCDHWECALDCIASEDEWRSDIVRNKVKQLQSNQAVLLEALERIAGGKFVDILEVFDIAQEAIKEIK